MTRICLNQLNRHFLYKKDLLSFLLSKIHTSEPSSLTSFHHLRPTSSLPEMFLTSQKSIAPRMITTRYAISSWSTIRSSTMNETIAPILNPIVKIQRNGCDELLIISVRPLFLASLDCWGCSSLLSSTISGFGFEASVLFSEAMFMLKLS